MQRCVETGWISSAGSFLDEFERAWADRCERRHGIAVSNGTTALELAVECLELDPGDEIIMPTFTIMSCALAAVRAGCVPVVVDSDPDTWCMDVRAVEARITERTRAIMPVHIYGHPVDMAPLLTLAERHNLAIIEDAAEAHGARYDVSDDGSWRPCGSFGELSTFSFYANKIVTTGEGGMVLTDDDDLAARAREMRNLAFHAGRRFHHERLGHNFRMTNLQAAVGVAQLERFPELVERKRKIGEAYSAQLSDVAGIALPVERSWAENVYWMYGIVLDDDVDLDAEQLARRLAEREIETRPFFLGLHEQPVLHERGLFAGERYPVAERIARRGLYLPSGGTLTDEQVERVVAELRAVLTGSRS